MLISETLTDNRILQTRKKLKMSLIQLMDYMPYTKITVNDIVKKANVNRSTFYNHYKNKKDLLDDLMEDIVRELVISFKNPYLHMRTFRKSDISPQKVELFQNVYKHKEFFEMIVKSDIFFLFQSKLIQEIKKIFLKELHVTNRKINHDINAVFFAYAIVGMIVHWVETGFIYSPKYMAEQLMEIINIPSDQLLIVYK
jgi:AcrR family transcriptional regulator